MRSLRSQDSSFGIVLSHNASVSDGRAQGPGPSLPPSRVHPDPGSARWPLPTWDSSPSFRSQLELAGGCPRSVDVRGNLCHFLSIPHLKAAGGGQDYGDPQDSKATGLQGLLFQGDIQTHLSSQLMRSLSTGNICQHPGR